MSFRRPVLPVLPVISRSLWLLLGRRRIATPQLPVPQGWIVDILFRPSSLPLLLRILCAPTELKRQRMRLVAVSAARRDKEGGSR